MGSSDWKKSNKETVHEEAAGYTLKTNTYILFSWGASEELCLPSAASKDTAFLSVVQSVFTVSQAERETMLI